MKDDPFTTLCVGLVFFGCVFFTIHVFFVYFTSYNLHVSEWNCTQSRIIDSKNVDKTECVVYKRVVKDDISR